MPPLLSSPSYTKFRGVGVSGIIDKEGPLDVFSYEVALGVGDVWGLSAEQAIESLEEGRIDGYKLDELAKVRRGGPTGSQNGVPSDRS
jgi:hypothetical protein